MGLLALVPTAANADDSRDLLERGISKYKAGRFEQSLALLEQAQTQRIAEDLEQGTENHKTAGRIDLYIGINHAVMRKTGKARKAFRSALDHDPASRLDPTRFKPDIVKIFSEVRRSIQCDLSVTSVPPGARVQIDGEDAGETPLSIKLAVGRHRVVIQSADDERSETRMVVVSPKRPTTLKVELKPPTRTGNGDASAQYYRRPRPKRRLWTWIAAGATVATLAVGVGVHLSAKSSFRELEDNYDPLRQEGDATAIKDLRDTVHQKDVAAAVMFAVSGALAATSVALFFVEPGLYRKQERKSQSPWSARIEPIIGSTSGLRLDICF